MGGSAALSSGMARAPLDPAATEYGHKKSTAMRMKSGVVFGPNGSEPLVWSGNRASLTNMSAILFNKATMNQAPMFNHQKFQ
jgi:hypothetical protein